ncbi:MULTISPECIES: dihydrolipoyllysine-residue acetyltransferase [Gammaproteobacteria]|uniref:dihydrolipoyllysine-residue acetyltransferase n=1 Tax=Gammaproteobacteria TaxID=1236 RepID=UPI000DD01360|nr:MULTISPECIES: dihydrolipoyllysine-residue acetyltransferase [Gammaproteobacteria]RTE86298.1 dihydrolipoyllysine-residue acetyltransferase [Aliidiomarina sp. B3213]TCZ91649.1 dihydrolipoyllysine-residue acetyltransferase [Lysobacter sp. N42]
MADLKDVLVPDVGGEAVEVIEVLVNEGDTVEVEDALVTVESDKASMDIPVPFSGTVKSLKVKVGDKISEGDLLAQLAAEEESQDEAKEEEPEEEEQDSSSESEDKGDTESSDSEQSDTEESSGSSSETESETIEVKVPDIGESGEVEVIEVLVAEGDEIAVEDGLITLETDKATMDVPSPKAGKVVSLSVKVGDKVSEGSVVLKLETQSEQSSSSESKPEPKEDESKTEKQSEPEKEEKSSKSDRKPPVPDHPLGRKEKGGKLPHASPSVRRLAREFGVELENVKGSGPKDRILKEDVQSYVKYELSRPKASAAPGVGGEGGLQVIAPPKVDFSKFGEIEEVQLTRIQRISGPNLHRNWVTIPHVTQFDEADITELEAFRKSENEQLAKRKADVKFTPLVFIMKAVAKALQEFPVFNSSLHEDGEHLIMKKYIHIGIAVDTPNGLVVPVIRDVDKKGIVELSRELTDVSLRARDGKLKAADMQGGCFSISSLGGIGGTAFTPIVNAPEVAILGVSKSDIKPVWNGSEFEPKLMLPLSLSYDHRVIDGAVAARFTVYLSQVLSDIRKIIL